MPTLSRYSSTASSGVISTARSDGLRNAKGKFVAANGDGPRHSLLISARGAKGRQS
jgi:hypothetical protein